MRSVPIAFALTVLGCDPAPTDLGGPEVDGTGTDGGFVTADREGDGTFLRKLDADRVEQWATLFEDVDPDTTTFVSSIDIAADGRIWAIGTDVLETPGPTWIVLLDGDGVVQWEPQTFHTPQERTIRVDATDDGAVVLRPAPDGRAWGFADDGTHEWSYTDGHVDAAHAFAAVASGGFVVARMVRLPEGDPTCQHDLSECATHIDVRRVDANEVVLWDATTAVANWTMDAEIAPDGTFVLLGLDVDNSTGAIATVLLRYGV